MSAQYVTIIIKKPIYASLKQWIYNFAKLSQAPVPAWNQLEKPYNNCRTSNWNDGRRPQLLANGRRPPKKLNGRRPKKKLNGRQPQF